MGISLKKRPWFGCNEFEFLAGFSECFGWFWRCIVQR